MATETNNNSEIIIRELKILEVPRLRKFRRESDYNTPLGVGGSVSGSLAYALLKKILRRDRMATLIVEKGGKIIGYANLVLGRNRKFTGNVYLVSTAVGKNERGKGIGTNLLKATEEYSRQRGARRIELEVFGRNTRAVNFYKRLGYEIEGVKKKAVENSHGFDDLILMAKFL